jgi:hypothetical protein
MDDISLLDCSKPTRGWGFKEYDPPTGAPTGSLGMGGLAHGSGPRKILTQTHPMGHPTRGWRSRVGLEQSNLYGG